MGRPDLFRHQHPDCPPRRPQTQNLNIDRQHREADYRAALLRVRDHAEQIAFYNGGEAETGRLKQRYLRIRDNWRRLTNCEFRQETFWATYVRISIFIPILATLPMYLAKTMTFGDMMQTRIVCPRPRQLRLVYRLLPPPHRMGGSRRTPLRFSDGIGTSGTRRQKHRPPSLRTRPDFKQPPPSGILALQNLTVHTQTGSPPAYRHQPRSPRSRMGIARRQKRHRQIHPAARLAGCGRITTAVFPRR